MKNDQDSWRHRGGLVFCGMWGTVRLLLSTLMTVATLYAGCLWAAGNGHAGPSADMLLSRSLPAPSLGASGPAPRRSGTDSPTPLDGLHETQIWKALAGFFFLLAVSLFLFALAIGRRHRQRLLRMQRQRLENNTRHKSTEQKRYASTQLMSQVIDFLPDPTLVIDPEGKVIVWNRAMEALTGVKAEAMLGKGDYEYALPLYGVRRPTMIDLVSRWDDEVAKKYINMERRGKILVSETMDNYALLNKGLFRNVAGPLYDDNGNLIGAIESIHDITSRRKAHDDLREQEELLRFFVTYTPVAVAMCDPKMNYLYYSRRWITDFKLPDEDLTGRCHYDVFDPIPEHWKAEHRRCLQGESIQKEDEAVTRADGSIEWVRRTLYPWRTREDKIGGIIILAQVTTEKKQAEQAAHEMEQRLRSIGDNLPGGLIFQSRINPDGTRPFTFISGNVEHFFGVTVGQVMLDANLIFERVLPEDRKRLFKAESQAIETLSMMDQMIQVRLTSGKIGWQRVVAKPRRLPDGEVLLDGIVIDITSLKEAEANLRSMERVVQNSPAVLLRREAKAPWPVIYVSANVEQFGYSPQDLTSGQIPYADIIHPDDRAWVDEELMHHTAAGNTHFQQEYRIITESGEVRWVDDRTVVERDNRGIVSHYQGVVLDISERKQAQEEVRRSERMLRRIMDMVPSMIFVKNAQGRFLMANQAVADSYGVGLDELVGKFQSEVHPDPEQVKDYLADDRQTIQSGQPLLKKEEPYMDRTGAIRWLEVTKLPCDPTDFGEPAIFGLATDITERRQVEAILRISQFSFDKAAIGIYWIASDAKIINVNEHAARMLGYAKEELSALSVCDIDPGVDTPTWKTIWRTLQAQGKDMFERVHRRKDGSQLPVEIFSNLLEYDGRQFSIAFVQDITERRETEARIQESEKRYRTMFENTGTGTVLSEADMTLSMVNREFAQMVGYARGEIEGKMKWTEFIAPEDLEGLRAYHLSRRKDPFNTPAQYECSLVDRAGRIKPTLLKVRLIPGTQTSIGAFSDISDRKRTEEALLAANRMLRLVLDTIPVRVFWKDTACRFLGCNRAFAGDAGFSTADELIGRDDYELVWYNQAPAYRRDDRAVMSTGQARLNYEETQTNAGGKTVWLQTSKVPMRDSKDNIIGMLGTYQDITERKRAHEELQRLRNYLSNIIDSMPSVLVGVDTAVKVTQWNKQAERHTGLSFEKAYMQPLANAFPRLAGELTRIKAAIDDRQVLRNLKIPRQHQGETRFEDITIFPLEANGVEGAVIRLDDVTDQVRMEEMMIQSEKMLSVGGLAAGMAHEINNPLAGILQNAAVLENRLFGDLPANRKAAETAGISLAAMHRYLELRSLPMMLENIRASGNRAAAIVRNMLSFARKSDRVVSSHDLSSLLDQTIELVQTDYDMKKRYDFKQIQIIREYDETASPVPCESSKIQQVFLNILKNGAEAMAEEKDNMKSPRFILRVEEEGRWVRVEIEDNGPGMAETTRRRIFEPFFTTKSVGKGTGLGLSVSYFIITEEHGGKMDAHIVDEGGTRFIIQLPKTGKLLEPTQ